MVVCPRCLVGPYGRDVVKMGLLRVMEALLRGVSCIGWAWVPSPTPPTPILIPNLTSPALHCGARGKLQWLAGVLVPLGPGVRPYTARSPPPHSLLVVVAYFRYWQKTGTQKKFQVLDASCFKFLNPPKTKTSEEILLEYRFSVGPFWAHLGPVSVSRSDTTNWPYLGLDSRFQGHSFLVPAPALVVSTP